MAFDPRRTTLHSQLPLTTTPAIEQLGREIMARVEAGEKANVQATDRFISAGLKLIEARAQVSDFSAFLRNHCRGLSRSRAYELIKIAGGDIERVRATTNERKRRYREGKATRVRSGTDTTPVSKQTSSISEAALAEFTLSVDDCFPRMNDAARRAALVTLLNGLLRSVRSRPLWRARRRLSD